MNRTGVTKRWDVVVLGSINTDYVVRGPKLPAPGQTVAGGVFYEGPGGKGANQAVAAARLGGRVAMIGCVGDEPRGQEMVRGLKREGIDTRHVRFVKGTASGAAIIGVGPGGQKQIQVALGANREVSAAQIDAAGQLIAEAKVLLMQFETPVARVLQAARLARQHGTLVVLDPGPPAKIPKALFSLVDCLRPNRDEAQAILGFRIVSRTEARRGARQLLGMGIRLAVVDSADGTSLFVRAGDEVLVPRLHVKAVDATGAGDAFAGALAIALAEGFSLSRTARFAKTAAALSTTKPGAQASMPTRREVERKERARVTPAGA